MKRFCTVAALVVAAYAGWGVGQETRPTTAAKPVKIDVSTKEGVEGAVGKDVVFTGRVESAKWSSTGKMMIIRFVGTPENFRGVAYQKQREALDKGGDFAKGIEGKDVEVTGRVRKYAGANAEWKDVIEVPVTKASQVKVIEKK